MKKKQSKKTKNRKMKKPIKGKGGKELINKNMTFGELMEKYPKAGDILAKKGLHCFGCSMSFEETIEMGAVMHRVDLKELLEELNEKLTKNNGIR